MCWPCRVVEDSDDLLALFIAAGSTFLADPKLTAAEKRAANRGQLPDGELLWHTDALRLMQPGTAHSVLLFWDGAGSERRLNRYFVNLEEPFRRTACGFDTQDHTLDVVVTPALAWAWRDEQELDNHVGEKFFTPALAAEIRTEGRRVIDSLAAGTHPCLQGWARWSPDPAWSVPSIPAEWSTTPITSWERRHWAYGDPENWK